MSNRSGITIDSATPVVLSPAALVPGAAKPEGGNYSDINIAAVPGAIAVGTAASGDLAGTYPGPTLAVLGSAATEGDGENVPVVTIDTKGRVTGLTTTPVLGSRVSAVNKQGSAITKGQAVYVYSGGSQKLFVKLAKADSETTSHGILGLVSDASIANNDPGYIRVLGEIGDINTSTLTEGAPVYLSATVAGGLTSTSPVSPNHSTYLGVCTANHLTQGAIYVAPSAGLELSELHDVLVSGAAAGDLLQYDGAKWVNVTKAVALAAYVLKAGDTMTGTLNIGPAASQLFLTGTGNTRFGIGFGTGSFSSANAVAEFKPHASSRWTFLDNVGPSPSFLHNPVLSVNCLDATGKAMALFADTTSSAFIFSDNGNFDITSDTKAHIESGTFGGGTLRFRVTAAGIATATGGMVVSDLTAARRVYATTSGRLTTAATDAPEFASIATKATADSPVTVAAPFCTILCNAAAGAMTVNLPAAVSNTGRILTIKKIDSSANAVTVDGNASETIDGALTYAMTTQWARVTVQCDGANWYIVG